MVIGGYDALSPADALEQETAAEAGRAVLRSPAAAAPPRSSEEARFCPVWVLDLNTWRWERLRTGGASQPPPLYSHSSLQLSQAGLPNSILVSGGVSLLSTGVSTQLSVLCLDTAEWSFPDISPGVDSGLHTLSAEASVYPSPNIRKVLWARHQLLPMTSPPRTEGHEESVSARRRFRTLVVGGGLLCFSFGTFFNPTAILEFSSTPAEGPSSLALESVEIVDPELPPEEGSADPEHEFEASANASDGVLCENCGRKFSSRNKLFQHLKKDGCPKLGSAQGIKP